MLSDVGEKLIYLTQRGVHDLSGIQALQGILATVDNINAKPLSYDVEPDLFRLNWNRAAGVFFKFYYILSLSDNTENNNNISLVYDTRRKVWYTPWDNFKFSCYDVINIDGREYCFAASDVNGTVYNLFQDYTDAGTKIESYFVTNAINFGNLKETKTFRTAYFQPVIEGSRGIYFSYSIDYAPFIEMNIEWKSSSPTAFILGSAHLGVNALGAGFVRTPRRFAAIGRRGGHCRLKFSNNNFTNTGGKPRWGIEWIDLKAYLDNEETRSNL